MNGPTTVTAAVLVIGDEILSGRTKDRNLGYIAEYLARLGVDVREARVVPDVEDEIVAALNALRARYDYVFTTGGIGPTHDDITADAVARAFGVPIDEDPRALAMMMERYRAGATSRAARRRMARIPAGAELIENPISKAPGFRIGNVIVMAGVPSVMQAMLDFAVEDDEDRRGDAGRDHRRRGASRRAATATALGAIAAAHPDVSIGSYPVLQGRALSTTRSSCAARTPRRSPRRGGRSRRCSPRSPDNGRGALSRIRRCARRKMLMRRGGRSRRAAALAMETATSYAKESRHDRPPRQGLSGFLGPVPPRRARARLAPRRRPGRSTRSSRSRAAGSCRRRSWRANSRSG